MKRIVAQVLLAGLVLSTAWSAAALTSPEPGTPRGGHAVLARAGVRDYVPPVKHVFVVVLENKDYERAWGAVSEAPYLAKTLRKKGVLLNSYYGTAHNSQGNYLAMISGQGVNPEIQADCQGYADWTGSGTVDPEQYVGRGCVFPPEVRTLSQQIVHAGKTWRGYMDDMGSRCRHPELDTQDDTQQAEVGDQYATRHNPFMYFHSILDRGRYCKRHVVDLTKLPANLRHTRSTRNLSYIVPDLCHDGHDEPCVDGRPGGMRTINNWMKRWMPRILRSPAFGRNGMLIVTSDESDGPQSDSTACCGEVPGPNSPMPGINGMGGGKVGALVISRWTRPNTWSTTPYNHYALLASLEDIFGVRYLGFARAEGLNRFGLDVYNDYHPQNRR